MFDVGFWELCLVGLVSLLVIGPEKLPKVARIAGFWLGKTQQMVASVKEELKEEFQEEEMRQLIQEQQAQIDAMTEGFNQRAEPFLENIKHPDSSINNGK